MININAIKQMFSNSKPEQSEVIPAVVELAVLLCRADKSIKLTEQEYLDAWLDGIELPKGTTALSLLSNAISIVNKDNANDIIISIAERLKESDFDVQKFAKELCLTDGEICDSEQSIIDELSKHLTPAN
jgi:hypothetical protein